MKSVIALLAFVIVAAGAQAKLVSKSVPYQQAGVKLEGYLVYDDDAVAGGKKVPGVLVIHEWWGLNAFVKERADALARLGYVAFALDMYGAGVTTEEPAKAGELAGQFYGKPLFFDRAEAGLKQLVGTGFVDPKRVASIGFCFGGAASQVLAFGGAPLAGVVSFHGSLVVPDEAGTKRVKGKMLMLHGAVDPFIKPEEITAFTAALEKGKIDYQFVSYAGAIHAFTNPGANRIAKEKGLNGVGYNANAARRSWEQMQAFFGEIFAPTLMADN